MLGSIGLPLGIARRTIFAERVLGAAGLRIHGCASDGRIDWIDPPTKTERDAAAAVLAAHDPQRREREAQAARDRLTVLAGRFENGTATPAESQEALARVIRMFVA